MVLNAAVRSDEQRCPKCSTTSGRVHSRYQRRLADLPVAGRLVQLSLTVRRFFCVSTVCAMRTFAEQVAGQARRWARRSEPLRTMLTSIGVALAGRAEVGIRGSRNSLLRLGRAVPDPVVGSVRVLGVDDFAVKRGHHYGTVLIDCESRRVVDLVPGRDASPLAEWLLQRESPQVICRDRASSYAEGARTGAPDAVQVADRFHLWRNLATAIDRLVAKHKGCLAEQPTTAAHEAIEVVEVLQSAMAQRRRTNHALVHEMLAQGAGFRQIARHLGWNHRTVSLYAHAATWQDMMIVPKKRGQSARSACARRTKARPMPASRVRLRSDACEEGSDMNVQLEDANFRADWSPELIARGGGPERGVPAGRAYRCNGKCLAPPAVTAEDPAGSMSRAALALLITGQTVVKVSRTVER
ncbi:ISL3 family transposase [Actinoplanes sp. NPDC051343]|uniref:ISL3 family transposase n=1 Tax=Actinoplanes sp. NPDC051343 TaxID=3363906 RepID=UPI00378ED4E3